MTQGQRDAVVAAGAQVRHQVALSGPQGEDTQGKGTQAACGLFLLPLVQGIISSYPVNLYMFLAALYNCSVPVPMPINSGLAYCNGPHVVSSLFVPNLLKNKKQVLT